MIIRTIPAGIYDANCYLILDEISKEIVIIDPGGDFERLKSSIDILNGTPQFILLTHGHIDHVGAVEEISTEYKIPFYISQKDEVYMDKDIMVFGKLRKADGYLKSNDKIKFADKEIEVIETPGHSEGGVCFKIENNLFTGDTLFRVGIGRTDFEGGNYEDLINSIKEKLIMLDDDTNVFPGHGEMSTIGYERKMNPYLE